MDAKVEDLCGAPMTAAAFIQESFKGALGRAANVLAEDRDVGEVDMDLPNVYAGP
jgi:hypothetical protein